MQTKKLKAIIKKLHDQALDEQAKRHGDEHTWHEYCYWMGRKEAMLALAEELIKA